jgi:hypothetical protein
MRGSTRTSRIAAYVASGALVVSGTVMAVTPAEAVTYDPAPANDAAAWLAHELAGGMFSGPYSEGLSIDAALALDEIGGQNPAVTGVSSALEPVVEGYISYLDYVYAGSAAKAAVLAQVAGDDATAFGGYDLIAEIEGKVVTASPASGRVPDTNVLGQAFASRALAVAGSPRADEVTHYLLSQQCADGYFRLDYNSDPTAANQSCVNGTDSPDTDVTAIVVTQLRAQTATPEITSAIDKAEKWLVKQQRCDGSYGGGTSTEASNANSTGLVAWALGDAPAPRQAASRQAAIWLRAHQADAEDANNQLADEVGAIAYDGAALSAGRADGITDANRDQFRRATAQAAPGIRWFSSDATPAINMSGPVGYVKQGTSQVLSTSGAEAGTVLCITGGASTRGIAGANGWNPRVTMPAGTQTPDYTVRDAYGHSAKTSVKVLGKKTFPIYKTKSRVKRSGWITAQIGGLASGESAKIYYKGNLVRTGKATRGGVFSASFRVGRSLGFKRVTGLGQFGDIRRGSTTVRVVR